MAKLKPNDEGYISKTDFLKNRKRLQKELADKKKELDDEFKIYVDKYMNSHCEFGVKQVLEKVKPGNRDKFKRFVLYARELIFMPFGDKRKNVNPIIRFGGWWLDDKNVPVKWDTIYAYGVANSVEMKLSENQKHKKPTNKTMATSKEYHSRRPRG